MATMLTMSAMLFAMTSIILRRQTILIAHDDGKSRSRLEVAR